MLRKIFGILAAVAALAFATPAMADEVQFGNLVFNNPLLDESGEDGVPMDLEGYEIIGKGDIYVCLGEDQVCHANETWLAAYDAAVENQDAGIFVLAYGFFAEEDPLAFIQNMAFLSRASRFEATPPYPLATPQAYLAAVNE